MLVLVVCEQRAPWWTAYPEGRYVCSCIPGGQSVSRSKSVVGPIPDCTTLYRPDQKGDVLRKTIKLLVCVAARVPYLLAHTAFLLSQSSNCKRAQTDDDDGCSPEELRERERVVRTGLKV